MDTAASPPRNPQPLEHAILGLVVLGSSRGRPASSRKEASPGDGELHFPEGGEKLGSPGKRPGRRRFPCAMGPVLAASVFPRGPRVVWPEVFPWLRGSGVPGAEPMSSSLAGPDCCGGLDNIEFRKVLSAAGHREYPERVPVRPRTRGPAGTAPNAWWAGPLSPGNGGGA